MNRAIVIVTILHVLMHSIFGCCNHACAAHSRGVAGAERCHKEAESLRAGLWQPCCALPTDDPTSVDERLGGCDSGTSARSATSVSERHVCRHAACAWLTTIAGLAITPIDRGCPFVSAARPALSAMTHGFRSDPAETAVGRLHARPLRLHLALAVLII
jgi:hypothetical protein